MSVGTPKIRLVLDSNRWLDIMTTPGPTRVEAQPSTPVLSERARHGYAIGVLNARSLLVRTPWTSRRLQGRSENRVYACGGCPSWPRPADRQRDE
jgi:hypothetical protein